MLSDGYLSIDSFDIWCDLISDLLDEAAFARRELGWTIAVFRSNVRFMGMQASPG